MTNQLLALLLTLTAVLCTDIGFALLKVRGDKVAERADGRVRELLTGYASDPMWLLGLFLQPVGYGFYLWALELAPLNIVQTTMSSGVVLFVVIAVWFLGERLTPREWAAVAAVAVGMILLGMSLSPETESSQSLLDPSAVRSLSLIILGICAVAWVFPGRAGNPDGRGVALGITSGLFLGVASIYARGLALHLGESPPGALLRHAVTSPYAPLTLCANMAGFLLLLGAFRARRASTVVALCGALSNVVPILGGMLVLGERLPAEPLLAAFRLLAFALTLGGAALLIRVSPSMRGSGKE